VHGRRYLQDRRHRPLQRALAVRLGAGQWHDLRHRGHGGRAVGTGFEYKLGSHLGVRAEIMHYGLPGRDLAITGVGAATDKFESLVGRAGITWYFQ
jgi:hypothetical protein